MNKHTAALYRLTNVQAETSCKSSFYEAAGPTRLFTGWHEKEEEEEEEEEVEE